MPDADEDRESSDPLPADLEIPRKALVVRRVVNELAVLGKYVQCRASEVREDPHPLVVGVCRRIDRLSRTERATARDEPPSHEGTESDDRTLLLCHEHHRSAKGVVEMLPAEEIYIRRSTPVHGPRHAYQVHDISLIAILIRPDR